MNTNLFVSKVAACKGQPTEWWFPAHNQQRDGLNMRKAMQLCEECPVVRDCLLHGLRNEPQGIWGGTREVEREVLRRHLGIQLELGQRHLLGPAAKRAVRVLRSGGKISPRLQDKAMLVAGLIANETNAE